MACIIDDHVRRIRWSPAAQVGPAASGIALSRPTPNPTSGGADFSLTLPAAARVSFELVDLAGRRVWAQREQEHAAGVTRLRWDGRDDAGREAAPGVYLARVRAGGLTLSRRVTKLR